MAGFEVIIEAVGTSIRPERADSKALTVGCGEICALGSSGAVKPLAQFYNTYAAKEPKNNHDN